MDALSDSDDAVLRVLVVAENLLVRSGLASLLALHPALEIVGQVVGGETFIDDLAVYQPDAVVYDFGDTEALAALVDFPAVILLETLDDAPTVIGALLDAEAVVYGVLLRDTAPEWIAAALTTVYGGLVTLDPLIASGLLVADAPSLEMPTESLTARETEVLQLLAEGLPNKLIAQRLNISANTVKFHINAILSKLEVQSRTEAVIRATRLGLVIL